MHPRSMDIMANLLTKVVIPLSGGHCLDVGAYDINGTYRSLIPACLTYDGLDRDGGPNVNIVACTKHWPIAPNWYDLVISGQTLEHCDDMAGLMSEIYRVCKPGGYCILIAPWASGLHRHPLDCWRIMPDGMSYLLKTAGFSICEIGMNNHDEHIMGDTWGIGHK
jgi:SAM-dependent methyltransferase